MVNDFWKGREHRHITYSTYADYNIAWDDCAKRGVTFVGFCDKENGIFWIEEGK